MLDEALHYYGMTREDITPARRWSRAKNQAIERDRETEDRRSDTETPRDGSRPPLRGDAAGDRMDGMKESSAANSFAESSEKTKGKRPENPGQKLIADNPPSNQNIDELAMDKLQTLALPATVAVHKRQEQPSDQQGKPSAPPDQRIQEEEVKNSPVFPGNPSLKVYALHLPPPTSPEPVSVSVQQSSSENHSDENVPKSPLEQERGETVQKPPSETNLDEKVEKASSKSKNDGNVQNPRQKKEINEKVFELRVMGQLQDMLEREAGSPHLNQPPAPDPPEYSPDWLASPPQELEDQPSNNEVNAIPDPPEYLPEWPSSPNPGVESLLQAQQELAAREESNEANSQVEEEESNSSGGGLPAVETQEAIGPDVLALLPLIWTLTNLGGIEAPARVDGSAPAMQNPPALEPPRQVTGEDVPDEDDNLGINTPQEKVSSPAEEPPIVPAIAISSDTVAPEPILISGQFAPKAIQAPAETSPVVEPAVPQEESKPWPKDPPAPILETQPKSDFEAGRKGFAVGSAVSIIGAAAAGVAAFFGVAFLAYPWWKRRQAKKQRNRRHARHWRPETITISD